MSARDELQEIVSDALTHPRHGEFALDSLRTAARILAAGYRKPRIIATAEELDALPDGSALLDASGDISTKHNHWWHGYETAPLMARKIAKYGPLSVLHEGNAS